MYVLRFLFDDAVQIGWHFIKKIFNFLYKMWNYVSLNSKAFVWGSTPPRLQLGRTKIVHVEKLWNILFCSFLL